MNPWVYRAVVDGEVVFEREVQPGQRHDEAWAAMEEAYERAR